MNYPKSPRRPTVDPYEAQWRYYNQCTIDYFNQHRNRRAYDHYFRSTEPDMGLPKHSRAMSSLKAKVIMATFLSRLMLDVVKNSKYGFAPSSDLPADNAFRHPLADNQYDKPEGDNDYEPPEPLSAVTMLEPEMWVVESTAEIATVENMIADIEFLEVGETVLYPEFGVSFLELAVGVGRFLAVNLLVGVLTAAIGYGAGVFDYNAFTGKQNRKFRSQLCMRTLLNILKNASEDVKNGFAANRALRTSDSEKRHDRKFRSRN